MSVSYQVHVHITKVTAAEIKPSSSGYGRSSDDYTPASERTILSHTYNVESASDVLSVMNSTRDLYDALDD